MPLSVVSVACVASKVCQLGHCADRLAHARHASLQPVLLSSSLSMLSGELYLRLKPCLVVKISPDIVTEHCCQVCVLFMMFCRSDCRQCADMVSDCAIRETRRRTMWFDLTPAGQRRIKQYSSYLIFTFYTNIDTSVIKLFHVVVFQYKKDSPCWPSQSKPSLKLLDCGRKIQNDVHIDSYYRKSELISWRLINITVFHMRFLSSTDQKRAESSTFWQFFNYRPPDKFRFTHLGEIVKMLCQELDIHIYVCIWRSW